jgi:hypothetical protein
VQAVSIKPFPILILRLDGGPDDGETRLMRAAVSVVPPERLVPSSDVRGADVREAELKAPWTWRYVWERGPEVEPPPIPRRAIPRRAILRRAQHDGGSPHGCRARLSALSA